jgi:SAM-dependent methyltransferase
VTGEGARALRAAWDRAYLGGLYEAAPPVPELSAFVERHLSELRADDPVLDLGCGNGRHLRALVASTAIVGSDISGHGLRVLALTLGLEGRGTRVAQAWHDHLPFGAESFAAALAIQSVQDGTLDSAEASLRELHRVVRDGGPVYLSLPAADAGRVWRHLATEEPGTVRYIEGPKAGLLVHWFSPAEISDLAGRCGFEVVEEPSERTAPRVPPLRGRMRFLESVWRRRSLRSLSVATG